MYKHVNIFKMYTMCVCIRAVKLAEKINSNFVLKYYQYSNYIRIYKASFLLGEKSFLLLSWGHKRAHRAKYYHTNVRFFKAIKKKTIFEKSA